MAVYWNKFHRELVADPSLPEFKKRLDKALGSVMSLSGCAGPGFGLDDRCGSFTAQGIL